MATKPTTIDVVTPGKGPYVIQVIDTGRLAIGAGAVWTSYDREEADEFAAELRPHVGPCRVRRAKRIVVEL